MKGARRQEAPVPAPARYEPGQAPVRRQLVYPTIVEAFSTARRDAEQLRRGLADSAPDQPDVDTLRATFAGDRQAAARKSKDPDRDEPPTPDDDDESDDPPPPLTTAIGMAAPTYRYPWPTKPAGPVQGVLPADQLRTWMLHAAYRARSTVAVRRLVWPARTAVAELRATLAAMRASRRMVVPRTEACCRIPRPANEVRR